MKWLIVTADDFGMSAGTNNGILEAHRMGILTSASLMVTRPLAAEAAALSREYPSLSVGLHLELDPSDVPGALAETERQMDRFRELMGDAPTHVDSHHDVHRDPRVLPCVLACGEGTGIPVRGHSAARHVGRFYGQWGGTSHFEQIGVPALLRLLDEEVRDGVTELTCHPGEWEPELASSYRVERPLELQTLCDARVREAIDEMDIGLIGFREIHAVHAHAVGSP